MQIRLGEVLAGPQSPGAKGAKRDATKMSLLPLLLATFLVAVRGGGHSEHHSQPRCQQVGTTRLSPSQCHDNPAQAWTSRSSSAASAPTPLPMPTPSASAAFSASPLSNHGATPSRSSGARPSSIIRALPRLPSSQARHFYSTSIGNCNRFHNNHQQWTATSVGDTSQEYYRNNKARTFTRIHAKQDLENNVAVEDYLDTAMSNLVQFSKNDNNGVEVEKTSSVASDDANGTAANDDPTAIAVQFRPILALCVLVSFLSALDRVAMSIAILPLASEFHYTETVKGQIASAVSYGYAAAILPVGLAVSVASPRALMLGGVGLWSLATLGTPWAAGLSAPGGDAAAALVLLPLLLMRAGMGAAEAVVLPTMQRILSNWVPLEKKATVLSVILSGFQLGTVCAYLVSPVVMDAMSSMDGGPLNMPGWRGMFYVYGLLGLLWMVPWWVVARDAPASALDAEDCEEILVNNMLEDDASLVLNECPVYDDEVNTTITITTTKVQEMKTLLLSAPWSDFASSPGVWAMAIAHAAKNWELYNLLAWTPTFFSEQYGLNVKDSALFSVLPSVCGMVGGLTAGYAADYILVKFAGSDDNDNAGEATAVETRTRVRKLFQSIALLGPAACLYLLSHLPDQVSTAQVLLGGAVGLQAFDAAGFGAATQEKAGERWAGLLYSLTSLPGVMLGSVSVSVTGQLLDRMAGVDGSSGWSVVFQINSAVCVVGALAFLLFYDAKKEFE